MDGRSRSYTGAATVAIGTAAASLLLGPAIAGLFTFVLIATATAYVLARVKLPFATGLVGSAAGGVLGAVALLGILGASVGKPLSQAGAEFLYGLWNVPLSATQYDSLDILAAMVKSAQAGNQITLLSMLFNPVPLEIVALPDQEKAALLLPLLETMIAQVLPGVALAAGLLTGGLGYYLPQMALQAHRRRGGQTAGQPVQVPPFASFKFPKYVVFSVFALQVFASFDLESTGFATLWAAASLLFTLLMTIQALAFLSFLLNRKKVRPWLQLVILAPALALFSWLMPYVGFFDALFDMRVVMVRVDNLKAKGKQVFTQDGLDELRKMDRSRGDDKNGKDGEDDEQ